MSWFKSHFSLALWMVLLAFGSIVACGPSSRVPEVPSSQQPPSDKQPVETPAQVKSPAQSRTSIDMSPKPTKIAFLRHDGTHYGWEIYTMDFDGTNIVNITNSGSMDLCPTWSPDGTKIAFESIREPQVNRSIYIMDADGKNVKCLTPGPSICQFPAWSPDGKKIAYCTAKTFGSGEFVSHAIWIMNADGSDKTLITGSGGTSSSVCPSWFPDSQRIAFVSNRSGPWEIYSITIDGSEAGKYDVAFGASYGMRFESGYFPVLKASPDGTAIAFGYGGYRVPLWIGFRGDIYIMSLNGSEVRNLTSGCPGDSYFPTWSPDGRRIAFTLQTKDGVGIYVMNADGNNLIMLIKDAIFPVWQR